MRLPPGWDLLRAVGPPPSHPFFFFLLFFNPGRSHWLPRIPAAGSPARALATHTQVGTLPSEFLRTLDIIPRSAGSLDLHQRCTCHCRLDDPIATRTRQSASSVCRFGNDNAPYVYYLDAEATRRAGDRACANNNRAQFLFQGPCSRTWFQRYSRVRQYRTLWSPSKKLSGRSASGAPRPHQSGLSPGPGTWAAFPNGITATFHFASFRIFTCFGLFFCARARAALRARYAGVHGDTGQ